MNILYISGILPISSDALFAVKLFIDVMELHSLSFIPFMSCNTYCVFVHTALVSKLKARKCCACQTQAFL